MLVKHDEYSFIKPIPFGIKGLILPVVDGTAEVCCETYEDVCYLVEMYFERMFWLRGWNKEKLSDFSENDITINRNVLNEMLKGVLVQLDYGWGPDFCRPVPADWVEPEYPLCDDPSGTGALNSTVKWRNSQKRVRSIPVKSQYNAKPAPPFIDLNTMRILFRELGDTKRYIIYPKNYLYSSSASFIALNNEIIVPVQKGNRNFFIWDDNKIVTSEKTNAVYPYVQWNKREGSDEVSDTDYWEGSLSTVRFWIKKGFLINSKTNELYYNSMNLYLQMEITVRVLSESSVSTTLSRRAIFRPFKFNVVLNGDNAGFEGYVEVDMSDVRIPYFIEGFNLAKQLFADKLTDAKLEFVQVTLDSFAFDTGVVKHNADLPDTWDWQPPNNNNG